MFIQYIFIEFSQPLVEVCRGFPYVLNWLSKECSRLKLVPGHDILDCRGIRGQIVTRYGKRLSVKLTLWLTGDRNGQGVDGGGTNGEEGENDFEEHDDRDCREKE